MPIKSIILSSSPEKGLLSERVGSFAGAVSLAPNKLKRIAAAMPSIYEYPEVSLRNSQTGRWSSSKGITIGAWAYDTKKAELFRDCLWKVIDAKAFLRQALVFEDDEPVEHELERTVGSAEKSFHEHYFDFSVARSWKSVTFELCSASVFAIGAKLIAAALPKSFAPLSASFFYWKINFTFPLLLLPSIILLGSALMKKYSYTLELQGDHLLVRTGLFSKISFEFLVDSILIVQTQHQIWERLTGVGTLELARYSRANIEIILRGLPNPEEYGKRIKAASANVKARKKATITAKTQPE